MPNLQTIPAGQRAARPAENCNSGSSSAGLRTVEALTTEDDLSGSAQEGGTTKPQSSSPMLERIVLWAGSLSRLTPSASLHGQEEPIRALTAALHDSDRVIAGRQSRHTHGDLVDRG